jgi:Sulfotransferase family
VIEEVTPPHRGAANPKIVAGNSRIIHLHIPKTAGTALRIAFERQFLGNLRVFPYWDEAKFAAVQPDDYDFYSGHIGFNTAKRLTGDIVTVLRHPVDRYLSVYFFWRQLYETGVERSLNTELAWKFSLDEFVKIRDQPGLIEEFENRATFQIAHGSSLMHRREMRLEGLTNDMIFAAAVHNLDTFKAVGIQENMSRFIEVIASAYGLVLKVERINVTKQRQGVEDLVLSTRRAIQDWVYMDYELYQHALRMVK